MFTLFPQKEKDKAECKKLTPQFLEFLAKKDEALQQERKQYQKAVTSYHQESAQIDKEVAALLLKKSKLKEELADYKNQLIETEDQLNQMATLNFYYSQNPHDPKRLIKKSDDKHFIRTNENLPETLPENICHLLEKISERLFPMCTLLNLDYFKCALHLSRKNIEIQFRGPYENPAQNKKVIDPIIHYFKENHSLSQEDENELSIEHRISFHFDALLKESKIESAHCQKINSK